MILIRKSGLIAALLCAAVLTGGCAAESMAVLPGADTQYEGSSEAHPKEPATTEYETEQEIQQETQTAMETVKEPVIQEVTVTAVGDCTLGVTQTHGYAGSFHEYYDRGGADYFFAGVREIFEEDDFTLVNLECVLSESQDRVDKTWNLKGKPEYAGIMTGSSVEGCSLGNNHTLDYGEAGLADTQAVLDEAGILYANNEHVAAYTTESGIVIGIVSSNLLWHDEAHMDYIKDGIAALRSQGADIVVVSCHWGTEREYYPTEYQRTRAHQIVDWGADLVIGTHPHVLQGVEVYEGKVICYSLGNFCFGGNRNPQDKDTAIYQQTFTFVDGIMQTEIHAGIIPCSISSTTGRNDFQPTVAEGERRTRILSNMNDYSEPYSNISFDDSGKLVLEVEHE